MKTSNKIFISFLIFLFVGIILLYLGSKYHKDYYDASNFADQKTLLSPFSVVVAEPGANFYLKSGKENKVIQTYRKDTFADFSAFVVRNDTLFISPVKQVKAKEGDYKVVPEIFCVNIKSLVAKENSNIGTGKFHADTLHIAMNKSRLNWRFDKAAFISIQAKDSDIYLDGENLEKITMELEKTKLRVAAKKRINNLLGSLKNDSNGDFSHSNSVHLDADKTSNYNFYDFGN
ncbi:hypothetical protein SAMN05443549_102115 [Flavobacterium fluvii]|uniref:Uncharacterized protein n=1 Tax=Flavobacterium fluvii TaxID=468056 RepID=A0A1M5H836_9FLAO|nr:hypothetical protein [Flavobacterium fluvii]SHG12053.1 hypothetical protein SAMN05443549_102115 [Flavobacterium fluvii]